MPIITDPMRINIFFYSKDIAMPGFIKVYVVKVNHRNLDTSLIANLNCININPNPSYFPSLDGRG
jgi:hypothetical protein